MNLQDLRYLVALAEHRHFGHAAEACHVSQPTMSNQIRKLEEELGVTLLERTNKRVDLTPVGAQILHHARQALIHTGQMEALARAARDPLVGPLKLGVIPTLAPYLMPIILKPLRDAYPGLVVELWEDQTHVLVDSLRNHRLDAALLATPPDSPEITEIPLFEEPLLAALPPAIAVPATNPSPKKNWPPNSSSLPMDTVWPIRPLRPAEPAPRPNAPHCRLPCRLQLSRPS